MQFILDPSAFPVIREIWILFGQPLIDHVYYLVRTFAYYIYREKQKLLGCWTGDNLASKRGKKSRCKRADTYPELSIESNVSYAGTLLTTPAATGPVQAVTLAGGDHEVGPDELADVPHQGVDLGGAASYNTSHAVLPCHGVDLLVGRGRHECSCSGKFECLNCWPHLQQPKYPQSLQQLGSSEETDLPDRGRAGARGGGEGGVQGSQLSSPHLSLSSSY